MIIKKSILHILNAPNNLFFTITDYQGNKKFQLSAKSSIYKSKQIRRMIVLEQLWLMVLEKLKNLKISQLTLKISGPFFKKRQLLKALKKNNITITAIHLKFSSSFNGCKKRHIRRI